MNSPHALDDTLADMPSLAELFRLFLSGKHLNRISDAALWAELEKQEHAYRSLFSALGYDLRIDARGFAWFHTSEGSSHVGRISRQLALLFMMIFETQANAGQSLQRFHEWRISREWLAEVHQQHHEVLEAEGIGPDEWQDLISRASTLGFAEPDPFGWRLLPAVYRYLEHFEALAQMIDTSPGKHGDPADAEDDAATPDLQDASISSKHDEDLATADLNTSPSDDDEGESA